MKFRLTSAVLTVGLMLAGFSCNIFSPTEANRHPEKERYEGYALVIEGTLKMKDGKFEEALDLFNQALQANDSLSEAWFYKGKCILRMAEVDLQQVWGEVNPDREDSMAVPFLFSPPAGRDIMDPLGNAFTLIQTPGDTAYILIDSVFLERKRIYDAVCQAIIGLEEIIYNPDRMDGVITRAQYESDYLVEISIKTVLGIIDYNNNDTLDFDGVENDTYRILCKDIPSLDSMELDSLKSISNDPKEINEQLDLMLLSIGRADTSYLNFSTELEEGAQKTDKLDPSMAAGVGDMINNFKDIIPFFYYDDFLDNDGDFYNTNTKGEDALVWSDTLTSFNVRAVTGEDGSKALARLDRMIWIDWDFDDRIDITDNGPLHIGDSIHIAQNPTLYEIIDTAADADYRRYRYKGPYTFEFIAGDWGVDEEIMDGEDNDNDGITDEDTRIVADTLDDDGDYWNNDPSPLKGDTLNPMEKTSTNNFVFEISGGTWDSVSVTQWFYANHWIHQPALTSQNYKLGRYKGAFPRGEYTGGDYGLDEEWFDGLDNDNDGLVDEDVGEGANGVPPKDLKDELETLLEDAGKR